MPRGSGVPASPVKGVRSPAGRRKSRAGDESHGNEVPIWLDASGSPVDRLLTPVPAAVDATVIAIGLWTGVVFLLVLAYRGVVFAPDRARLAQWEQEWFAQPAGRRRWDDQSPAGS